jgi:hypothetical protein
MPAMPTPFVMNERIADSRPDPTPLITTEISFIPIAAALSARTSPIFAAAKGVPFFAPLNPREPDVDHASALPLCRLDVEDSSVYLSF